MFQRTPGVWKKWGRISQQTPCSSTKTKICYNLCLALLVSIFTTSRIIENWLAKKGGTVEKLLVAFKNFFSKLFYFSTCSPKMSNALSFSRWGTLFLIRANSHKGISSTNMKKENFSMKWQAHIYTIWLKCERRNRHLSSQNINPFSSKKRFQTLTIN